MLGAFRRHEENKETATGKSEENRIRRASGYRWEDIKMELQ
jgi:hypothetical protein